MKTMIMISTTTLVADVKKSGGFHGIRLKIDTPWLTIRIPRTGIIRPMIPPALFNHHRPEPAAMLATPKRRRMKPKLMEVVGSKLGKGIRFKRIIGMPKATSITPNAQNRIAAAATLIGLNGGFIAVGEPQSGQKRAFKGSSMPQLVQKTISNTHRLYVLSN